MRSSRRALRFSLQPVRQEALRRLKGHIEQQQAQSEPEIRAHLEAQLTQAEQERLSQLLERNRNQSLTAEEQSEYEIYVNFGTFIALLKSKARLLLSEAANA